LGKKKPAGNVSGGLCFSRHGLSGFWTRPTDLVKKQFPFEGYRGAMRSMSRRPASPFAPPCRKACHPGRKLELRLYVWHRRDEFPNRAPYYDFRHLELFGPIIQPAGIMAKKGCVTCFPEQDLVGSSLRGGRKFGERLGASLPEKPRPIGYVSYQGEDYSANLHFPSDILPAI
jgi:hypothetical protein